MNDIKIIDCFTFYNELDMLEFRLEELDSVVDKFVLVEATRTFVGKEKPLFFELNKQRYKKYLHKIVHIVEDGLTNSDPWINESTQRNAIDKGIKKLDLKNTDIIIISDLDEIPDTDRLIEIKNRKYTIDTIASMIQDMYYYNLTCKDTNQWNKAKILEYYIYKKYNSPQKIRIGNTNETMIGVLKCAGWHFSYFGDTEFIKNKIKNFSHQEYNTSDFVNDEHIQSVINSNVDLFNRPISYKKINPDENIYLPKNYKKLISLLNKEKT